MKQIIALLLCLPLLLTATACGKRTTPLHSPKVLQIAVQQGLSAEAMTGLDCFIQKIGELSNDELAVEIIPSEDVLDALDGGCALILANNSEIARADANFSSYTSPFYFYDYTHLSLTLNSQKFHEIIRDSTLSLLGALPIAAFYDGNSVILSSSPLVFDTVDQFEGAGLTIANDPVLSELLRGLGTRVRIREEEAQRIDAFLRGSDHAIECRITSLSSLTALPGGESFTICKTFHRARVNWLMLSEEQRHNLTIRQQAVITEAAAYAIAKNDTLVLSAEAAALAAAEQAGGDVVSVIFGEFFGHAERILRASIRYGGLWNWEQHLEIQQLTAKDLR